MAPVLSLAVLGVLFSLPPAFAIKSKSSGDDVGAPEVLDNGTTEEHTAPGESVKVTTNGWTEEHKDFQVVLVSDHSSKLNKLASGAAEASEHNGSDTGTQIKTDDEKPSVPIVGVRIPGYKDEEEERSHAAVLLYKDPSAPTEIPLDTIANPKTPLMVLFEHSSPTEVTVTVYTWKSEGGKGRSAQGSWQVASATAGTGKISHDTKVDVNDCSPRLIKMYASSSKAVVTIPEDKCDDVDPPIVAIPPSSSLGSQDDEEEK